MSISRTVNITCPSCGTPQDVELYDAINVEAEPHLKEALMQNALNRVNCADCETSFRVDLPMLYNDPKHNILIHWIPENEESAREDILEEFERSLDEMSEMMPADIDTPSVRLVMTRVELIELIYIIEAGLNQRIVEYVKYSIYTRNMEKIDPKAFRLLLNVEDSTAEELCFVTQDVEKNELGIVVRYGGEAYKSMEELYKESPEEFMDMFPGPCISARDLLLEDENED